MIDVTDEEFDALISEAFDRLPKTHRAAIKNVAIVYADEPTPEQRVELKLQGGQSLFGLYEGVPLAARGGRTNLPPDKITIFKVPMLHSVNNIDQLREQVRHTLWHEVAHYFGLNHQQIDNLDS